jgi:hypothetical protein
MKNLVLRANRHTHTPVCAPDHAPPSTQAPGLAERVSLNHHLARSDTREPHGSQTQTKPGMGNEQLSELEINPPVAR